MMFTDADSDDNTKSTSLLADVTNDSCRLEYIEIVPLDRDTRGSYTTDCDSGDWSAQVKQENLAVVKQEPEDVCCIYKISKYAIRSGPEMRTSFFAPNSIKT